MIDSINKINSTKAILDSLNNNTTQQKPESEIDKMLNPSPVTDIFNPVSPNDLVQVTSDYKLTLSSDSLDAYTSASQNTIKTSFNDDPYTASAEKFIERYEEDGDENFLKSAISFYEKSFDYGKSSLEESYTNIAETYEKLGDYDSAKDYYGKILEADEGNIGANTGLLNVALEEGDLETAASYVTELENATYLDNDAKLALGDYYLETEDTDTARSYYYDVVASDNSNVDGIIGLAKVNMEEENYSTARDYLTAAFQMDPTNSDIVDALTELNERS